MALACVLTSTAAARPIVKSAWERAVEDRETFEASGVKTKAGFTRVLDGFRAVYHGDPGDAHAAEAVKAVAEVLTEQGRELGDPGSLKAAVGQYEFLRSQYPASSLRTAALLAEARIEDRDLGDETGARDKYRVLVKEAPHSESAAEARSALLELEKPRKTEAAVVPTRKAPEPAVEGPRLTEQNVRTPATVAVSRPADEVMLAPAPVAKAPRSGPLAQVTGIRHWSTPTYTRVAIDLGDQVTFEAARVPHPDRIYFDLHGAKLAQDLVNKSFDVTDDGFLKKIRAAQSSGDVTRVVLDVNDVTEYSAFLLPNPYRLIIDIHGGTAGAPTAPAAREAEALVEVPVAPAAVNKANAAANSSGLPPMAPTDGGEASRPAPASIGSVKTSNGGRTASEASRTGSAPAPAPATTASGVTNPSVPAPRTSAIARTNPGRPVPNTVAIKAPAISTEVAAVSEAPGRIEATTAPTSRPIAVVSLGRDIKHGRSKTPDPDAAPVKAADKTADGETSLVRALGLKIGRIVIDAGHGGHDSGTLGVDGIEEKDVVLDVALRLGKLLHERLGAEIIYTRSDDTFIPLETRTAIANKAQADLFLSIHANSSQDSTARGVETYYLNFTSDATALDVAARENAVGGQSVHQLSDLVKRITLKDKIAESREFATDVESSLYGGLAKGNAGLKDRGVKKAPFVVLIGANMPSILAEISFVTNPRDAAQLHQPEYRERVAESLFNGVAKYQNGLAGAKPAPVVRAAAR